MRFYAEKFAEGTGDLSAEDVERWGLMVCSMISIGKSTDA